MALALSFDSRENYQKKYLSNTFTTSLNAGNSWTTTTTILHTLGYAPNAKAWQELDNDGVIYPPDPINSTKECNIRIRSYTDKVEFIVSSPTLANDVTSLVYYEIYLDADDNGDTALEFWSEYPIDKVLTVLEGTVVVGGSTATTQNDPHELGSAKIFKGIWSLDNTNWYSNRDFYDPSVVTDNFTTEFKCNATNLVVYVNNNYVSGKTCYYKVALIEQEVEFP